MTTYMAQTVNRDGFVSLTGGNRFATASFDWEWMDRIVRTARAVRTGVEQTVPGNYNDTLYAYREFFDPLSIRNTKQSDQLWLLNSAGNLSLLSGLGDLGATYYTWNKGSNDFLINGNGAIPNNATTVRGVDTTTHDGSEAICGVIGCQYFSDDNSSVGIYWAGTNATDYAAVLLESDSTHEARLRASSVNSAGTASSPVTGTNTTLTKAFGFRYDGTNIEIYEDGALLLDEAAVAGIPSLTGTESGLLGEPATDSVAVLVASVWDI